MRGPVNPSGGAAFYVRPADNLGGVYAAGTWCPRCASPNDRLELRSVCDGMPGKWVELNECKCEPYLERTSWFLSLFGRRLVEGCHYKKPEPRRYHARGHEGFVPTRCPLASTPHLDMCCPRCLAWFAVSQSASPIMELAGGRPPAEA